MSRIASSTLLDPDFIARIEQLSDSTQGDDDDIESVIDSLERDISLTNEELRAMCR